MPSSSTHTTALETRLYTLYRFSLARLWHPDLEREYTFTHHAFATVLDVEPQTLERCARNASDWIELLQQNGKLRVSERIWQVSNALADVAEVLRKAGRGKEGGVWRDLAGVLGEVAGGWLNRGG